MAPPGLTKQPEFWYECASPEMLVLADLCMSAAALGVSYLDYSAVETAMAFTGYPTDSVRGGVALNHCGVVYGEVPVGEGETMPVYFYDRFHWYDVWVNFSAIPLADLRCPSRPDWLP